MASFNQPVLQMVVQGSGTTAVYAVATATLTWNGGPVRWAVKSTPPTAVDGKPLPNGTPFSISNWQGSSQNWTADLNFSTNITNAKEWDEMVFNRCRQVKLKLSAIGSQDVTLIVGTKCYTHPLQQSFLALVEQAASLVGSAVLLVLRWPLQFFRQKMVSDVVNGEIVVESLDPRFDPAAAPAQSTPPPELEHENSLPRDQKQGAA